MEVVTKTNKVAVAAIILLGLIFVVFGLNFFLHFIPATPPDPTSKAGAFLGGLFVTGYFFVFLKVLEVLFGLFLLFGLYTPLILVMLFPISLNILLFHAMLEPQPPGIIIAALLFALNVYLGWVYRSVYAPLFKVRNVA